jgi:hypothetical protein
MPERSGLPRRAFLRLAAGAGVTAAAVALAACDATKPSPASTGQVVAPTGSPPTGSASPAASPAAASATPAASIPGPMPTPGPSVAEENRRTGSPDWARGLGYRSDVEVYAAPSTVEPGERIVLHVASPVPFDVDWYRVGWYDGAGARLVHRDVGVPAAPDRTIVVHPSTGLVEADWAPAVAATVPDTWRSGLYVAVVRPTNGTAPGAVPFIVRAPLRSASPNLFVSAQATWQAYNAWGGKSLYSYNSIGETTPTGTTAAATVSFDRPYEGDGGLGYLRKWEVQFIRWMERNGRNVDYVLDTDLETRPEVLAPRRFSVLAGHAEYWSRPMRQAMERAVAAGMNAAFFSANEIYWQVRLGASKLGADRHVTCYKSAKRDPVTATKPALATCRWREAPVLEPEAAFLGVMYGHVVQTPVDWVVRNSGHWIYEGTGLRDGDRLVSLVGQEYDAYFADLAPAGTVLIARSPVPFVGRDPDAFGDVKSPAMQSAVVRDPAGGAGGLVAAGTFQWSWALDPYGLHVYNGRRTPLDPRVERMTANVFDRFGG